MSGWGIVMLLVLVTTKRAGQEGGSAEDNHHACMLHARTICLERKQSRMTNEHMINNCHPAVY